MRRIIHPYLRLAARTPGQGGPADRLHRECCLPAQSTQTDKHTPLLAKFAGKQTVRNCLNGFRHLLVPAEARASVCVCQSWFAAGRSVAGCFFLTVFRALSLAAFVTLTTTKHPINVLFASCLHFVELKLKLCYWWQAREARQVLQSRVLIFSVVFTRTGFTRK